MLKYLCHDCDHVFPHPPLEAKDMGCVKCGSFRVSACPQSTEDKVPNAAAGIDWTEGMFSTEKETSE